MSSSLWKRGARHFFPIHFKTNRFGGHARSPAIPFTLANEAVIRCEDARLEAPLGHGSLEGVPTCSELGLTNARVVAGVVEITNGARSVCAQTCAAGIASGRRAVRYCMTRSKRAVQFALAERISHLAPLAWDSLTRDASVFMRRPFLSALEAAAPTNVSARYALMYLDDEPVAALQFQLVRIEGRSSVAANAPMSGIAQLLDERALVLGNFAGWGETGLVIKAGVDSALVWSEALRLIDRLRRFEKAEGAVNVSFVKDAATEEDERALRRQGYQRAPTGPDMQLTLDPAWSSFDDYLACLASKRRRAVKKTLEAVDAAGYRVRRLSLEELEGHQARLDALYGQVWEAADVHPLRLSGRFFVELQKRLGDDCVTTGIERERRLDGFGVSLRSGATCIGYYLGFDKSVEAPIYQRLLVSILEQAFTWRSAQVSMGRTAEETKARLGATAGPRALWVKHRTPPLNWAVGAILGSLQVPELSTHRVFRTSTPQPMEARDR